MGESAVDEKVINEITPLKLDLDLEESNTDISAPTTSLQVDENPLNPLKTVQQLWADIVPNGPVKDGLSNFFKDGVTVVSKHQKAILTGIAFFLMSICMFQLGRHTMDNQLQSDVNKLSNRLELKDSIISNMTIEEGDIVQKNELLRGRINEEDNIVSNLTMKENELVENITHLQDSLREEHGVLANLTIEKNELVETVTHLQDNLNKEDNILLNLTMEKDELVEKATHLQEDNDRLKEENDNLKDEVNSMKTENAALRTAPRLTPPPSTDEEQDTRIRHWWGVH